MLLFLYFSLCVPLISYIFVTDVVVVGLGDTMSKRYIELALGGTVPGVHKEEVMAFGSFDGTARVWWPEDRPSAQLSEEPITGFFDTGVADIGDTDLEDNDDGDEQE